MKKHLLLITISVMSIVSSCSKKDGEPMPQYSATGMKPDSIIKTLGIKLQDEKDLTLLDYDIKDKNNNQYMPGIRNNKFWLGVYTNSGRQLYDKTFDEDPQTINMGYGEVLDLYHSYNIQCVVTNNLIFFIRASSNNKYGQPLAQALTTYNINTNEATTDYTTVMSGYRFISNILPWAEGFNLFFYPSGNFRDVFEIVIEDRDRKVIETLTQSQFPQLTTPLLGNYLALNKYDFISFESPTSIKRRSIKGTTYWKTDVKVNTPNNSRISIASKVISGNDLIIKYDVLSFEGLKSTAQVTVNIETGVVR